MHVILNVYMCVNFGDKIIKGGGGGGNVVENLEIF